MTKISVLMITYNQEQFVQQALESIFMQQTRFSYEVVIGDDASQDDTQAILESYQARHPETIRLLLRSQNIGMNHNLAETLSACTGEYVALLEGDDYWTAPDKLQKQAAFLDLHPECSQCFHPVRVVHEQTAEPDNVFSPACKPFSELEDLLRQNFMQTNSIMFRRGLIQEFPPWFYAAKLGDWPLNIFLARHGYIGFLDEVMAVYRKHPGGVWSAQSYTYRITETIKIYRHLNAFFERRYDCLIQEMIAHHLYELVFAFKRQGDLRAARHAAWQYAIMRPSHLSATLPTGMSVLLRAYSPDSVLALVKTLKQSMFSGIRKP